MSGVSNANSNCSSGTAPRGEVKPIEIDGQRNIYAVAFLDERHVLSGGDEQKIRRWLVQDGKEVGTPLDARSVVVNIAVSRDGKWIASGGYQGWVTVWNAESNTKVVEFQGHHTSYPVDAVDISLDGTRIASGAQDCTASVWSLSSGQRLLGPLQHNNYVIGVKYSPDGRLIATATYSGSARIYNSQNGSLLFDVSINVNYYSRNNQTLAWERDSAWLFALSHDGNIHCLNASTGAVVSKWTVGNGSNRMCISLASDSSFISTVCNASVSYWDTMTHKQIGSVVQYPTTIVAMAISAIQDIVIAAGNKIHIRKASDVSLSSFVDGCTKGEKVQLEDTIRSLRVQQDNSNVKVASLEANIQQLRNELDDSQRAFDQKENSLNEIIDSLRAEGESSNRTISNLEHVLEQLRAELADTKQKGIYLVCAHEQKHRCEVLFAEGHVIDAASALLEMINTSTEEVLSNKLISDWFAEFGNRCISALELAGDQQAAAKKQSEALSSYFTALLLGPHSPNTILAKWASAALISGSEGDALESAAKFKLPKFFVYRALCDTLEGDCHVVEAIQCFRKMQREIEEGMSADDERARWEPDFRGRCADQLEKLGDVAIELEDYDAANGHYSVALSLDPLSQREILLKRSKLRTLIGLWEDALVDADKAIELDSSSPRGYEYKHAALLGTGRYDEAIDAYNEMILKLEESSDPIVRNLRDQYISPSETMEAIRISVKRQLQDAPLAIINTETGYLRDARERMEEFEAEPMCKRLVAEMRQLDHDRINKTVQEYFRYATFSHTWEGAEPLYRDVQQKSIHKLKEFPKFSKLVMFCQITKEAGLRWAWMDSCCINKEDGLVLQESLTSMFKWYQGSSHTVIHLRGITSTSDLLALLKCLWNTRAWTLQEFLASNVVRFYTEDWQPYLPEEDVYNQRESFLITDQMAAVTGIDAEDLLSLRPGPMNARRKLCLAAKRNATRQEDMAYSLYGIFDVSLPVKYGEGQERALGRLLQEVLARSGDVTILSWTGKASEFNSSLPATISAYHEQTPPHIPLPIEEGRMATLVTELRTSLSNLDSVVMLYDRIVYLPRPGFANGRLKLSCLKFPIRGQLVLISDGRQRVYRGATSALGKVEIRTRDDLSQMDDLMLVHPWLPDLVDQIAHVEPATAAETDGTPPFTPVEDEGDGRPKAPSTDARIPSPLPSPTDSAPVSPICMTEPQLDRPTCALRLFARLRQPFGALLLALRSQGEYKRVAADHLITVQLLKNVSARYLLEKMVYIDVL